MFFYHVPRPDEALLISGNKTKGGDAPFRVVTGHGTFANPFFRKVNRLSLALKESEVDERCVTGQGIELVVKAVLAFKIAADSGNIVKAAQRFLSDQNRMEELAGRIFAGHLRSIVGSMTVEDIIKERQKLADAVLEGSKVEMERMGLVVDSLQIQSIDDGTQGYIKALSQPHLAAVTQAANIAQAIADQASAEAQQKSVQAQSQYERDTQIVSAKNKAEVDVQAQTAAQAGPLAQAQAEQKVVEEQAKLASKKAELREAQLVSEVIKPAEAAAKQVEIAAKASAAQIQMEAEALNRGGETYLEYKQIMQIPGVVDAVAKELSKANLTVFNGGEGLTQMAAAAAGQGAGILEAVRRQVASSVEAPAPATTVVVTEEPQEDGRGPLN